MSKNLNFDADQPEARGDKPITTGRADGQDGDENLNSESGSSNRSARKAGVVIRATVEHIGLVGDTELTVNVKWPASTFCVPSCGKPVSSAGPITDSQEVPPNGPLADFGPIYGPSADPGPAMAIKAAAVDAAKYAIAAAGADAEAQADGSARPVKAGAGTKRTRRKPRS